MDKKKLVSYIVWILLALLLFGLGGRFSRQGTGSFQTLMGYLSDCFLFPAVLEGGLGALSWIASHGSFDMLGYAFSRLANTFFHFRQEGETFYDYKMRKEEQRDGFLVQPLVVGGICLALSLLCLLLFLA